LSRIAISAENTATTLLSITRSFGSGKIIQFNYSTNRLLYIRLLYGGDH